VTPSIDDAKQLLFPIRFKDWLKLGFISMLGGGTRTRFNPNINFNTGGRSGTKVEEVSNEITGSVTSSVKESTGPLHYLIASVILVFAALFVILHYITSVFTFVFLEALDTRKIRVIRSFKKNQGLGVSFFLFKMVYGLIVLAFLAIMLSPIIINIVRFGFVEYFENFQLSSLLYLIPMFLIMIPILIAFGIFFSLVFNFSVTHMYFRKLPIVISMKQTFREMKKKALEVFVFLIAKFVINLATGIIAVIVTILLIIPFLIIMAPLAFLAYFMGSALAWSIPIIVVLVLLGIVAVLLFVYVFSVIFLPVSVFSRYFSINNYKALMKR
jgi:hypothetical protein